MTPLDNYPLLECYISYVYLIPFKSSKTPDVLFFSHILPPKIKQLQHVWRQNQTLHPICSTLWKIFIIFSVQSDLLFLILFSHSLFHPSLVSVRKSPSLFNKPLLKIAKNVIFFSEVVRFLYLKKVIFNLQSI